MTEKKKKQEYAVIVGVQRTNDTKAVEDEIEEMESLLKTLNIKTKYKFIQHHKRLSATYLLGRGKIEKISQLIQDECLTYLIIDHSLSPPQMRNLNKKTQCTVLDREGVILDIFANHAKTKEAKTQVEIAKLEYLLPRLAGAWTHFQRQTGGGVRARGMGEAQIEVDRRRARQRISRLKKQLEQIAKEKMTQRKSRRNEIKVSLVGYTNSGKTTLMKGLTRNNIEGKDELFATLDARVRSLDPSTRPKILLSDTVGFIRNLPHNLVESFRSTLEEVVSGDLLLHVVDVSHPNYDLQMEVTNKVLEEIGAKDVPMLLIFNKIDQVEEEFLPRILNKKYPNSITVSALNDEDTSKLRQHIFNYFEKSFEKAVVKIDVNDQTTLSFIHRHCIVLGSDYEEEGEVTIEVRAPNSLLEKIKRYCI
ncbi:MAG: GTPase HflX [Zetaproteobacteria bacterium]|nr:GTPase HflX [Pseudobdellovibrionaceae bacterium]